MFSTKIPVKILPDASTLYSMYLKYSDTSAEVISRNISNSSTPGYKARTVSFADFLSSAKGTKRLDMSLTSPMHIKANYTTDNFSGNTKYRTDGIEEKLNGNNVNIGHELSELERLKSDYASNLKAMMNLYNLPRKVGKTQ